MMMMMMMMMHCVCGMVNRGKAFSLISTRDHCQRSTPSQISDTPRAGFETAQNLSSGLVDWSCEVVITTTPWRHMTTLVITSLSCNFPKNPCKTCVKICEDLLHPNLLKRKFSNNSPEGFFDGSCSAYTTMRLFPPDTSPKPLS